MNRSFRSLPQLLLPVLALALLTLPSAAPAAPKTIVRDMNDVFKVADPLAPEPFRPYSAMVETTIRHQVFFSDMDGNNSAWSVVNYRAGQPVAWQRVTGAQACVGTSWWCGIPGMLHGDGYDNNWVQTLKTVASIDLAGTTNNKLTFKYKIRTEAEADWCWVAIKSSDPGAHYDTLAAFSGDFGGSCNNATLDIPNSFTTAMQPVQLRFFFGSDLTISAADTPGGFYTGWSIDDVKVTAQGNNTRFFDDMEGGASQWLAESPDPGSLWHIEDSPGTSQPATCFFLNTYVWVPFSGVGFGLLPDFCDAMLISPVMDLEGVFSPNMPGSLLRLQFDDWENLPPVNGIYWALMISGSTDQTSWTPWANVFGSVLAGGNPQCYEKKYNDFDPWMTIQTGIPPGTRFIRLGFRIRDYKLNFFDDGGPLRVGYNTEGIYFDNIGVYHIYAISGVETVGPVPLGTRLGIRKVYPNPFNPRTTIEFSVPKAGPVAVRIFDIQGKEVATVASASMGPGVYRARWDGRDRNGSDAASGVYFARIQGNEGHDTARLMLLK